MAAIAAEIVPGFDALPSLRQEWRDLFLARANEPSVSYEWTAAMARHHVRPGDRTCILQLRRAGRLVGLVPLVQRSVSVLGQQLRLLLPIAEEYNTHSDLLLADTDPDTVAALVTALLAIEVPWDCFRMARLLEANPLVEALTTALAAAGRPYLRRQGVPAYVLDLPTSFDAYLHARSAKFRNHLRRVSRKLDEAGRVEVHRLRAEDDLDAAFDRLLDVERDSWKHAHGTAISAVDHQTGFYHDLMRGACDDGRLHLQWLTLDGRPIAYNLGYLTAAGYHYLKTSYVDDLRTHGPATVLRAHLVESLIADGVPRLDFPGDPYQWEAQWTETVRWRTVLSVYASTLRGRVLGALERLRPAPPVRALVHVDPRAQRAVAPERR